MNTTDHHSFGGVWTRIKLEALGKYIAAFNLALSKQNFTRIYIDAFAGTGRCEIKVAGGKKSIEGSARRALATEPGFHKFYFIELAPDKLVALNDLRAEYQDRNIEVISGEANTELKSLCKKYQWKNERAVLFLDPFGMQVAWETLKVIAETGAIDVWYLFPYAGLYRQAPKSANALDAGKEAVLTRLLGTDTWREAFYMPNPQSSLFGDDEGDVRHVEHSQMLKFVSKQLKNMFPAVTEPKVLYQGGTPLFALYFAASNPKPVAYQLALKIAAHILDTL